MEISAKIWKATQLTNCNIVHAEFTSPPHCYTTTKQLSHMFPQTITFLGHIICRTQFACIPFGKEEVTCTGKLSHCTLHQECNNVYDFESVRVFVNGFSAYALMSSSPVENLLKLDTFLNARRPMNKSTLSMKVQKMCL